MDVRFLRPELKGFLMAVEEQGAATSEIARNVEQAAQGTTEVSSNITQVTQAPGETGRPNHITDCKQAK